MTLRHTLLAVALLAPGAFAQHDEAPPPVHLSPGETLGEPIALLPRSTTSFGAVQHDGWLYVLGGYFGTPHDYVVEHQSRDFYRIDLHDPRIVQALPNELRVQSVTLEAHGTDLLRVGGMVVQPLDDGLAQPTSIAECALFDVGSSEWSPLPPLPEPRSSHDSVVVGDNLYVLGGWRLGHEDYPHWYDEAWVLDLSALEAGWKTFAVPFRRRAVGAAAVDGKLIVVGGIDQDGRVSSAVDVFDLDAATWSQGPAFPGTAFGAAAIGIEGRVFVSAADGVVRSWAPGETEWARSGQLVFPRFFHQFSAHPDGGLVAVGGIGRDGRVSQVERLRLDGEGVERLVSWKLPYPSGSKNRQGLFVREGSLYVFGGSTVRGGHDFDAEDFTDACFRVNLAGMQIEETAPFPSTRQTMQSTLSSGGRSGLAVGGFGHDGVSARTFADSFRFDFEERTWTEAALHLPGSLSQFGLAEHGGELWIFGGYRIEPDEHDGELQIVPDILSASVPDGTDEELAFVDTGLRMPTARRGFGGAVLNDAYYVVGGVAEGFQAVGKCEVFDFTRRTWSEFPAPTRPRISPELVELDGKLYLAGGLSPSETGGRYEENHSLECYDPATSTWTQLLDELPVAHGYLQLRSFRGHILFFSTNGAEHSLAEIALYRPGA